MGFATVFQQVLIVGKRYVHMVVLIEKRQN